MWAPCGFGPGAEALWVGGLNRPISKTTLVGRCWPPGACPHSAPALTLSETLGLLQFQRRRASGQRRPGETALSRALGIVYPKPLNPHHLRPPSRHTLTAAEEDEESPQPASWCPRLLCHWPGNLHLGSSQRGVRCQSRPAGPHWVLLSVKLRCWKLAEASSTLCLVSHRYIQVTEPSICFFMKYKPLRTPLTDPDKPVSLMRSCMYSQPLLKSQLSFYTRDFSASKKESINIEKQT